MTQLQYTVDLEMKTATHVIVHISVDEKFHVLWLIFYFCLYELTINVLDRCTFLAIRFEQISRYQYPSNHLRQYDILLKKLVRCPGPVVFL